MRNRGAAPVASTTDQAVAGERVEQIEGVVLGLLGHDRGGLERPSIGEHRQCRTAAAVPRAPSRSMLHSTVARKVR